MKSYLLEYINGNGYFCGCCRHTSTSIETMEFESEEAAKKFIEDYNNNDTRDRDSHITRAYELAQPMPIFDR